jgi:hypothetical protein
VAVLRRLVGTSAGAASSSALRASAAALGALEAGARLLGNARAHGRLAFARGRTRCGRIEFFVSLGVFFSNHIADCIAMSFAVAFRFPFAMLLFVLACVHFLVRACVPFRMF